MRLYIEFRLVHGGSSKLRLFFYVYRKLMFLPQSLCTTLLSQTHQQETLHGVNTFNGVTQHYEYATKNYMRPKYSFLLISLFMESSQSYDLFDDFTFMHKTNFKFLIYVISKCRACHI